MSVWEHAIGRTVKDVINIGTVIAALFGWAFFLFNVLGLMWWKVFVALGFVGVVTWLNKTDLDHSMRMSITKQTKKKPTKRRGR